MTMTRKASPKTEAPLNKANAAKVVEAIGELLDVHQDEVNQAIDESESRKITVTFAVDIDASDSAPSIDIKCRFTPCTVTDKRTLQCEDPNQTTLSIFTPAEMEKRAKQAALEKAKAEKAAKEDADSGSE